MTVAELGRRMSSAEFGDWMRYEDVEPFGPLVDGAAAAWLANVNKNRERRPEPVYAAEAVTMFSADRPGPKPTDEAATFRRDSAWAEAMLKVAKPPRKRKRAGPT